MDHWSHEQVLRMLEGGNEQLDNFFSRHAMDITRENAKEMLGKRYKTKAAQFYRENLGIHVSQVQRSGIYQGRQASRQARRQPVSHCETM